jgi:isopentenyl-diphosphate delta-isomerase
MDEIRKRKEDHVRINLEEDVRSGILTGFDDFRLIHCALPEINYSEVDTSCEFLGRQLDSPILISSMTGGTTSGDLINIHLAEAANNRKVAMAIGSQRVMLESGDSKSLNDLRKVAPHIPLYANLGAVQLNNGITLEECKKVIDVIQADGLFLHLNPLQEVLQENGQTNFKGLLRKIEEVCRQLEAPVIVKEVGWGVSTEVARKLIDAGVSAIDVAGAGGTSWSEVEKHRTKDESLFKVAGVFRNWGIPTAYAVQHIHQDNPELPIISSGGLRNGLDLGKSIALGASIGGYAGALLHAAVDSAEAVIKLLDVLTMELRIAMFASGVRDIQSLSEAKIEKINR